MTSARDPGDVHEHVGFELLLTSKCNLRCDYCIARDLTLARMDAGVGRAAVDLFVSLAEGASTTEYTLTGGEPLLEWDLLRTVVDYAEDRTRRAGMRPLVTLKTNGTLLDGPKRQFLRDHAIKTVISIDGDPSTHDRHRGLPSGTPSHSLVHDNLVAALHEGVHCVASMTVHPGSARDVARNVLYLFRLGATQVDVGPAYGTVAWMPDDVEAMASSLHEVAKYIRSERRDGRRLEVAPLLELSEHRDGRLAQCWGCGAISTQLAALPDGRITGCSALAMLIDRFPFLCLGHVQTGLDDAAVATLSRIVTAGPKSRSGCASCETAENCTGGCLAINLAQTGEPFVAPPLYCEVIRQIPDAWRVAWTDGPCDDTVK